MEGRTTAHASSGWAVGLGVLGGRSATRSVGGAQGPMSAGGIISGCFI